MSAEALRAKTAPTDGSPAASRGYANYVLVVLVLVYVFNFIDRQILSILAEEIKADLGLTDAALGFLYGTAFAVFYAIFGIPLARLADAWTRRKLIAIGLFFWSAMTALSGTARSFLTLAVFRIGVGVGESSASPAAFSMLGDYFPPRLRATAVAIYSSGVYIGAGLGIFLGGWIVEGWRALYPDGNYPFGITPWQAAFFAVGLPGLLMAIWVWTLREPQRGVSEGITTARESAQPLHDFGRELAAVLPPFNLWSLWRAGTGGRGLAFNLMVATGCALGAWVLIAATGSVPQWTALAVGLYAFFSWIHGLALRDPAAFGMIYRSRAIVYGMIGFGWVAFVGYGIGFWAPPFFLRVHDISTGEASTVLGLSSAIAGWIGVSSGGLISDYVKQRHARARPLVGVSSAIITLPIAFSMLLVSNLYVAYVFFFLFQIFSSFWIGSAIALATELVMPRMRATASAFYILSVTFVGLALGPYAIGQISDGLVRGGTSSGEALRRALLVALAAYGLAALFLWLSSRHVADEEASRLERASAAGEL